MAIGNLSRIGKKVPLTDLPGKGGSMDTMDFHSLVNEYNLKSSLSTNSPTSVSGFGNRFNPKNGFRSLEGTKINSQTYMNNSNSDYNGGYHVSEMFFDITSAGTHKLYIGHKHTLNSGAQWCADVPMVGAQILNLDGSLRHNITFTDSTMEQNVTQYSTPPTPQALSAASFIAVNASNSYQVARFNYRTGTPSPRTGAQYGFDNSAFDNIPYPVSIDGTTSQNRTISQEVLQKYVYREVSSSSTYLKSQFMRTTGTYDFPSAGSIRIAYANTTETARFTDLDENDTILIGIY